MLCCTPENNLSDSAEDCDCNDYNSYDCDSQQEDFVHHENRFSIPHSDCPSTSILVTPPEFSDPADFPGLHKCLACATTPHPRFT